jgi:lysophospholipid acyltransferase (LPLAT)-like uncharacterized protein
VKGFRFALAGWIGRGAIAGLMKTVTFRIEDLERYQAFRERDEPVIIALWHGRLLPLVYHLRGQGIAAMVSQSKDGEYIARVIRGWGYYPVRGSTSRRGREALQELVHEGRARSIAITPDGPRGPRQKLQSGVVVLAHRTGLPVIPLACGCTRAWWPGRWDRVLVPKPFSTVTVRYGEPYRVPRDASHAEIETHRAALEARMNRLIEELDGDGGPTR